MFIFDHLIDVMILLVLALLVFGPKRLIQMGTDLGRALRQFREATRGISWSDLLSGTTDDAQPPANVKPFVPSTPSAPNGQSAPASAPHATATSTTQPAPAEATVIETTLAEPATTAEEEPPRLR